MNSDIKIKKGSFNKLCKMNDGLVLIGTGGDLMEWINGVSGMWKEEGISNTSDPNELFKGIYTLITTGGRIDLVLDFKNGANIDINKLAIWRLRFGDASWISDFVKNYSDHY